MASAFPQAGYPPPPPSAPYPGYQHQPPGPPAAPPTAASGRPPAYPTNGQQPSGHSKRPHDGHHSSNSGKHHKHREEDGKHRSSSHKHHHHGHGDKGGAKGSGAKAELDPDAEARAALLAGAAALEQRLRRGTPFLATVRFKNDLPPLPGDPKLLVTPQPLEKLAAFSITSVEKAPRRDLILPPDLGIPISLLDVGPYVVPPNSAGAAAASGTSQPSVAALLAGMHPADVALLGGEDEVRAVRDASMHALSKSLLTAASKGGLGPSGRAGPSIAPRRAAGLRQAAEVSWLMKTTYISADSETVRKQGLSEKKAKDLKLAALGAGEVGGSTGSDLRDMSQPDMEDPEALAARRAAQLAAIEATFAAAREPPVHPTRPNLRPVEVMELVPDVEWWGRRQMYIQFSTDPTQEVEALASIPGPDGKRRAVARSLLKGFKTQGGPTEGGGAEEAPLRIMALYVPSNAAPAGQAPPDGEVDPDELQGPYRWAKDYVHDLPKKTHSDDPSSVQRKQTYLLRFTGGKALYCDVDSTLKLRRLDADARARSLHLEGRPSTLLVRKRQPEPAELQGEARRRRLLVAHGAEGGDDMGRHGVDDLGA